MKLLIYGAGGLAKEVYDIVARTYSDKYEKIYFIDDFVEEGDFYLSETIHFDSIPNMFKDEMDNIEGVVAVGEPSYREMLTKKFEDAEVSLATIIDKTALISPTAKIEKGSIICEFVTIHADVHIGKGCLIQPFTNIGHDIKIGDFTVISSACAPGGVSIFGKRVYMGMNATSKEKISIGDDAVISMGAVVFRDVEDGATVVGNPARVTRGNDQHKVFCM